MQCVLHRNIKSSNALLDKDKCILGRLWARPSDRPPEDGANDNDGRNIGLHGPGDATLGQSQGDKRLQLAHATTTTTNIASSIGLITTEDQQNKATRFIVPSIKNSILSHIMSMPDPHCIWIKL